MPKISMVTTVKSSIAVICHFLDHHLALGARQIHVFLDDADAADVDALRRRYDRGVSVLLCDAAYWRSVHGVDRPENVEARQRMNADHALALARRDGDDWIAHVDIDEYLRVQGSLPAVLAAMPADTNVVRMDVLEAIPRALEMHDVFDIRHFKFLPYAVSLGDASYRLSDRVRRAIVLLFDRLVLSLGNKTGETGARHGFHNFYNAHMMGKCITRVSADVRTLRLHFPWFVQGVRARVRSTPDCRMMHFESCSFSEWVQKWRRRSSREGFAAALDRRQLDIFERFAACAGDQQRLEALYRDLYIYSAAELRWLERFGLVKPAVQSR